METPISDKPYRERLFDFVKDPELKEIDTKFEPYFELHGIEDASDLFDVVQSLPNAITGRLVWKTQRDLPIELKKAIIGVYSRYFVQ
jgi:hypothetical protein